MNKLRLIASISVCVIGILSVSTLVVIFFCGKSTIENSLLGAMLTAISVIVAMGVGYSIINVHDYSNKVTSLAQDFVKFKQEINDSIEGKVSMLQFANIAVERKADLNKKNMAAKSMFDQQLYLQALKTEYDILVFIFENYEYFKNEFDSFTGSKRQYIANDLLQCIKNVNEKYVDRANPGEIDDIVEVILRNVFILEKSMVMKELYKEEQERFKNIYKITKSIVKQIYTSSFPLSVPLAMRGKLEIYADKIIFGDKPDDKQFES